MKEKFDYQPLVLHETKHPEEIKSGREERRERRKENRKLNKKQYKL